MRVQRICLLLLYVQVGAFIFVQHARAGDRLDSRVSPLPYENNLRLTSSWLASQQRPDGAILYTNERINPYFANLASSGLLKDPSQYNRVQAWLAWYLNHLNAADRWGLAGTIYDYKVANGEELSTGDADSTDAYAGTFLSLVSEYYWTGDLAAQGYVKTLEAQLDTIGSVIAQTQQVDGLTWAKPDYQIKFLMDNCEAYRGLRDLAGLFRSAFNNSSRAAYYDGLATRMLNGLLRFWLNGRWAVAKNAAGTLSAADLSRWYPDAVAQLFPALFGLLPSSDPRLQKAYSSFNSAWPGWPTLSFNSQDPFPWTAVGAAAARMGDGNRANTYILDIESRYVNAGFPWPWYSAEAGWFMRLNSYMLGQTPF